MNILYSLGNVVVIKAWYNDTVVFFMYSVRTASILFLLMLTFAGRMEFEKSRINYDNKCQCSLFFKN